MTLIHNGEQLFNHICGEMVSAFGRFWVLSLIGSNQNYKIGICCLSA